MRLDLYLSENKLCDSRNKASSYIRDGKVKVNGSVVNKPSFNVSKDDDVTIDASLFQYVARSAAKLLTAIDAFSLDFLGKTVVDLGSSTGGFCQVMLENGVEHIFAVDIGTNQLHAKLKDYNRISVRENTNARYISRSDFDRDVDIVTCDLSFISLKLVVNAVFDVLKDNGEFICLVKPQFEVGSAYIGKNGVVRDKRAQVNAVNGVIDCAYKVGFSVYDISFSGLEGESGNKEFLLYLKKDDCRFKINPQKIIDCVIGS